MSSLTVLFALCGLVALGYAFPNENEDPGMDLVPEFQQGKKEIINHSMNMERQRESDVCYDTVGCFSMVPPWNSEERPVGPPGAPEKLKTTITFYSRKKKKPHHISQFPNLELYNVNINWKKKNVIIVHGFRFPKTVDWKVQLKDVYLAQRDVNVMLVDWGSGLSRSSYARLASSARVVGRQLAQFVRNIIMKYKVEPEKIHLIGHSLGAHICSYLAKEVPNIGRLTALDPAQPYFEGFSREVRLDRSDADFVEVIHTDSEHYSKSFGFGMVKPYGDVDFFINGGRAQPSCYSSLHCENSKCSEKELKNKSFRNLKPWIHCSHERAFEYFIDAVNETKTCLYLGKKVHPGNMYEYKDNLKSYDLKADPKPISDSCTPKTCVEMGLTTHKTKLRGLFLVETNDKAPFCKKKEEDFSIFGALADYTKAVGAYLGNILSI